MEFVFRTEIPCPPPTRSRPDDQLVEMFLHVWQDGRFADSVDWLRPSAARAIATDATGRRVARRLRPPVRRRARPGSPLPADHRSALGRSAARPARQAVRRRPFSPLAPRPSPRPLSGSRPRTLWRMGPAPLALSAGRAGGIALHRADSAAGGERRRGSRSYVARRGTGGGRPAGAGERLPAGGCAQRLDPVGLAGLAAQLPALSAAAADERVLLLAGPAVAF